MSSSVCRFKERGGGGGKVVAEAPLPSYMSRTRRMSSEYSSSKESVLHAKPAAKPIAGGVSRMSSVSGARPIVRKTAKVGMTNVDSGVGSDRGVRWSTSSLPKREPSGDLSHFARFVSDLPRERIVRTSNDKELASTTDVVKKDLEGPFFVDTGKKYNKVLSIVKDTQSSPLSRSKGRECVEISENDKEHNMYVNDTMLKESPVKGKKLSDRCWDSRDLQDGKMLSGEAENLDSNSESAFVKINENADLNKYLGPNRLKSDFKVASANDDFSTRDSGKEPLKLKCAKRVSQNRENGHLEGGKSSDVLQGLPEPTLVKYPSKIREKLASLEGRVKSIASEIKLTKEMLDANNPDASKSLLLDIQGKISGIEKAVGTIVQEKVKLELPKLGTSTEKNEPVIDRSPTHCAHLANDKNTVINVTTSEVVDDLVRDQSKPSIKCLSNEELEARLFPHHKLLRNRPSLLNSTAPESFIRQNSSCNLTADSCLEQEDGKTSPVEENPIAREFLASLKHTSVRQMAEGVETAKLKDCWVQEMLSVNGNHVSSDVQHFNKKPVEGKNDLELSCDEQIQLTHQENMSISLSQWSEDSCDNQLVEIGTETATGGWFISEGESVLLAHTDGSYSFNDLVHCEEKSLYVPPSHVPTNLWGDIWLIRATVSDGCTHKYVVAASAGNSLSSGFCSWDFYTKEVQAFQTEGRSSAAVASIQNRGTQRMRNVHSTISPENRHWWFKPCGPLIASTATACKDVRLYDIRDADLVMKWETQTPVAAMDFSSSLQWRNKEKVVIAETEAIGLWDVASLVPRTLSRVSCTGKRVSTFHIHNTDSEFGGGIRQRISSSETEGNDGVFCTSDNLNIFDFRVPSGIGLKIPKPGVNAQSVFARGDAIFLGSVTGRLTLKGPGCPMVQYFSLRKGRLMSTYSLPGASHATQYSSLMQVWGSSELVMAACDRGLFVFNAHKDEGIHLVQNGSAAVTNVREVICPDSLCCPSFDYAASRALLISRDRPACWKFVA